MTIQQAFELALSHYRSGQLKETDQVLRRILLKDPNHSDSLHLVGLISQQTGGTPKAAAFIRRAIAINPNVADYHNNLGLIVAAQGALDEGIASLQRAIQLRPDFARAHNNLGTLYSDKRQWDQAIACFRTALSIDPNYAEAESNLASALKETGLLDEAIDRYQRAMSLRGDPKIASNLLYLLYFHPAYGPSEIVAAHRDWNHAFAAPLASSIQPHTNNRDPDRRLRVGYVSPDFRQHAVGRFIAPLLEHHDHIQFEIYCYSDVPWPDTVTQRLQDYADVWRDTPGVPDQQLAELIRSDQIDILIDLTMHMEGNRLLTFARKPAPVQITYLAYAGTTGLQTMNYRLSDPYLDPPGEPDDSRYTEKTLRLQSYWCYQPPPEAPAVVSPPSERSGHITFGCLNTFAKVTPAALDTWARILSAVPSSQLILHTGEGSHRQSILNQFAQTGIAPDRIEFVSRLSASDYFEQYNKIDIALDPFPYPGGTTTCDALWMGVPVITFAGNTAVSRAGVSILSTIGLPDLIAGSVDQYISIAHQLALDPARRLDLRSSLRRRMQSSGLMNAKEFAIDFEKVLREAWRTYR